MDKDSRRRPKGRKKRPAVAPREDLDLEETAENETDQKASGKVVDIII